MAKIVAAQRTIIDRITRADLRLTKILHDRSICDDFLAQCGYTIVTDDSDRRTLSDDAKNVPQLSV
jgi:hypothetical protein